jgi:[acyl-carrier-protein] S-malonyltransferase
VSTALLFPGQGSQQEGMRALVAAERPELLELAHDLIGADPFARLREGTAYLQPAIYCASLANLARLSEEPDFYAGHSLGEITALVAAECLDAEDGLRLVATRGRLMQRVATAEPAGAMLALELDVEAAREFAASFGLTLANDNSPEQVVLSGAAEAVEDARSEAKRHGLRAFRLHIQGAFHAPQLESVTAEFREALDEVEVRPARRPVFSGVTAREFDDVRRRLVESLTHGVRWREVVIALRDRGVDRFFEVGPGRALTKLVQRTLPQVEVCAAGPGVELCTTGTSVEVGAAAPEERRDG